MPCPVWSGPATTSRLHHQVRLLCDSAWLWSGSQFVNWDPFLGPGSLVRFLTVAILASQPGTAVQLRRWKRFRKGRHHGTTGTIIAKGAPGEGHLSICVGAHCREPAPGLHGWPDGGPGRTTPEGVGAAGCADPDGNCHAHRDRHRLGVSDRHGQSHPDSHRQPDGVGIGHIHGDVQAHRCGRCHGRSHSRSHRNRDARDPHSDDYGHSRFRCNGRPVGNPDGVRDRPYAFANGLGNPGGSLHRCSEGGCSHRCRAWTERRDRAPCGHGRTPPPV